jgi:UDPglucose 6-dehydrogenase/GDP-mannose 6-dehydrogenase
MRISIIGSGYVGLVSGACLADRGHEVVCVDNDERKVRMIERGDAPIHEAGLAALLRGNVGSRLFATTDLGKAVAESEVTFIAVGTPDVDGHIDLKYVEAAAADVGRALRAKKAYHTLVVKSTVIPGTTDGLVRATAEGASGKVAGRDFGLGMNPEFLTEGRAIEDFMRPDRIVLGGIDERSQDVLQGVYASFDKTPTIRTNCRTAEMIKYASNSLLATMISYSNEIARLCTAIGDIDSLEVMRGVHQSLYLTTYGVAGAPVRASLSSFLEAGCGFGGSCLPKDVTALVAQGADLGVPMPVLKAVLEVNRQQPEEMVRLVTKHFSDLRGVYATVLGLAFKPDTDDVRESPAFPIIRLLRAAGAKVTAYDPIARPHGHPDLKGVRIADTLNDALERAEVVLLVTRWPEFDRLGAELAELGRDPLVIDGRRVLDHAAFPNYEGIGWRRIAATSALGAP